MTITDDTLRWMLAKATEAGDQEQVAICQRALDGDNEARQTCAMVLSASTQVHRGDRK